MKGPSRKAIIGVWSRAEILLNGAWASHSARSMFCSPCSKHQIAAKKFLTVLVCCCFSWPLDPLNKARLVNYKSNPPAVLWATRNKRQQLIFKGGNTLFFKKIQGQIPALKVLPHCGGGWGRENEGNQPLYFQGLLTIGYFQRQSYVPILHGPQGTRPLVFTSLSAPLSANVSPA